MLTVIPPARFLGLVMLCLNCSPEAFAQHAHHAAEGGGTQTPAWVTHHRGLDFPVTTGNAQAQRLVEQGLLLVYAFNHDAAEQAFADAARADPDLAMAHWGVALANGSYINGPFTPERYQRGRAAIERALVRLSGATPRERAYIDAMALRYAAQSEPDHTAQQQRYAAAMHALSDRYRDDLHAATLYADSRMTLNPWRHWSEDGRPAASTADIVAVLESVLQRDPDHLGANHLLIHALEASPQPERALAAAMRLEALNTGAGHLAHMPGHIYMRLGDFEGVVRSNVAAVRIDEAVLADDDVRKTKYVGYHLHNFDFVVIGHTELGNQFEALRAARAYEAVAAPRARARPGADYLLARQPTVLLRFNLWRDVLALPQPGLEMPVARAYFAYARGVAHAGLGDGQRAASERANLRTAIEALPAGARFRGGDARHIMAIAAHVLDARIALAAGEPQRAIDPIRLAIALQDGLRYDEPPSWDVPLRETLGAVLLRAGMPAEAETAFRECLDRHPRGARALFGLAKSLQAQSRDEDAALVEAQFRKAWAHADVTLGIESL